MIPTKKYRIIEKFHIPTASPMYRLERLFYKKRLFKPAKEHWHFLFNDLGGTRYIPWADHYKCKIHFMDGTFGKVVDGQLQAAKADQDG